MAGFQLSRTHSQGDLTGKVFEYDVADTHATLLSPGDVMRITGTSSSNNRPEINAASAAGSITGILFGVKPNFVGEALSETGLPASTAGSVLVNIDARALYEADVTNGTIADTEVGQNVDFVATAATKTGGLTESNMTIDAGTNATTATLPFRIVARLPNATSGLVDGTRVLVRINESTVTSGATGV